MHQTLSDVLSRTLKPLCPRDSRVMHYEAKGINWKGGSGDTESMPSYHCGYTGCSVRYTPQQGYFIFNNPQPSELTVPASTQSRKRVLVEEHLALRDGKFSLHLLKSQPVEG